ncbi:unnamed protein product [Periconia digitata]|uniref:Uncharacterized protein n=1 Tax=Periconia digitata TaxID=1303443 RepID=A0A9W4UP89_9PLEO|nr:unnamed protein product [Periconia digitata]
MHVQSPTCRCTSTSLHTYLAPYARTFFLRRNNASVIAYPFSTHYRDSHSTSEYSRCISGITAMRCATNSSVGGLKGRVGGEITRDRRVSFSFGLPRRGRTGR